MSTCFFISCVSDEFASYRDALRAVLDRPLVRVETQETFLPQGDRTLPMLEDYIRQCDAVIHLFGERTGAAHNGGVASKVNVDALLTAHPDLPAKLGVEEAFLRKLSYQFESQGDFPSGFSAASEALTLMETLTEKEPGNLAHQRDLSIALNSVGRIRESQGEFGPALEVFERSQRIRETLTGKEPGNLAHQRELYLACLWCGRTCRRIGDGKWEDAERYLSRAAQLAKALVSAGWTHHGVADDLQVIEAELAVVLARQRE
jgi:hypothetical protein